MKYRIEIHSPDGEFFEDMRPVSEANSSYIKLKDGTRVNLEFLPDNLPDGTSPRKLVGPSILNTRPFTPVPKPSSTKKVRGRKPAGNPDEE